MNTTAEITQQLRLAAELIATLARDQDSLTAEQHAAVDAVLSGTTHEPPPFQLPPRPPGMRWHREDGWKAEDLPQGYRPHALGEIDQKGDQRKKGNQWSDCACATSVPSRKVDYHRRTTRPLVFTHEGKEWTYHRPGDPMPCDGEAFVYCLCDNEDELTNTRAKVWTWGEKNTGDIIGWRYAETTKQVELGPEDVPPFSVLRIKGIPDPWNGLRLKPWTHVSAFASSARKLTPHTNGSAGAVSTTKSTAPSRSPANGTQTLGSPATKHLPTGKL
jgi:hypothetical protein